MSSRTNLRRRRSRQNRRDTQRIPAILIEATRRARNLGDRRSAFELAEQLETLAAREEVLVAIERIVRHQVVLPLDSHVRHSETAHTKNGVQG